MTTPRNWRPWKLAALLMLPALQACSTTSAVPPPVTPSLPVTPLPAEISQINTSDSQRAGVVGELVTLVHRRDAQLGLLRGQLSADRKLLEQTQ